MILCFEALVDIMWKESSLKNLLLALSHFSNTYVPILPKGLVDYLNAPTPFLYGIHASYCHLLPDIVSGGI